MEKAPFDRIKDPEVFRTVTAYYGALTWFPDDDDLTVDIDPEWCYANSIEVEPAEIAQAIQDKGPIRSFDFSVVEKPKLTAEDWSCFDESDSMDPKFLEIWLPNCADDEFPVVLKSYFGNEADMKYYMKAIKNGPWATVHEHRLAAYQQYCNGNRWARTPWKSRTLPLFTSHKVAFQQYMSLDDVHWIHVDRENRMIPLRARRIALDQVLLEIGEDYLYCIRPSFEGVEQANFKSSQWVPVTKTNFPVADVIDVQDGNYRARLYVEVEVFDSFALALSAIETPGQVDLTAVMDEFFGEFA